jgi:hypothetical protein
MDPVERACRIAKQFSNELPGLRSDPGVAGVGLRQPEFDQLVAHQMRRMMAEDARLDRAAQKAGSSPGDPALRCALRDRMERSLRGDPAKLEAIWTLVEAAGEPPESPHPESDIDPTTPGKRVGKRLAAARRRMAAIVASMGTLAVILVMAVVAAAAIVVEETGSGATFLRWFVVLVLASLPGWLFLRFIVFRAGALWSEYVLNLHRLQMDEHQNLPRPPMSSSYYQLWAAGGGAVIAGSPSIYQQKFEAHYGKVVGSDGNRKRRALDKTIAQVVLATAVLAAGWAAVLAREPLFGPLEVPLDVLRFGFMGAYVFVLQMLIRRFFQSDLKASAYLGVVVRMATVLIVVVAVHYAMPSVLAVVPGDPKLSAESEVALAFVIGFFPLLGMQIIQKAISVSVRRIVPTLRTPYPLSDLDGLNIWYEARLLEEGIEDMQNLVTGNLVDIILHTRVPVGRLVDWIDQAALQLVVDPPATSDNAGRPTTDRTKLRRLGIRTATDLESMFLAPAELAHRSSWVAVRAIDDKQLLDGIRTVLNDNKKPRVNVTEAMLKAFSNVPNLVHVRHWRDVLSPTRASTAAPSAHSTNGTSGNKNGIAYVG